MIFGFNTDVKFGDTVYHVQSEAREHDELLQTQVFVKGRCIGKHATSFSEHVVGDAIEEEKLHDLLKAQHKRFVESARAGTIEQEIMTAGHTASGTDTAVARSAPPLPAPAEEERAKESLSDDPDLAAIAEASAATINDEPPHVPAPSADETTPAPDVQPPADPMMNSFLTELQSAEMEGTPSPLPQYRMEPAGSVIGTGVELECLEPVVSPDGSGLLINVAVAQAGVPSAEAQITCRIAVPNAPATYVYANSNQEGIADVHLTTDGLNASTSILIQASVHGKSASRKFNLKRA